MKAWFLACFLTWSSAAALYADPVVLVNTLTDRPVFTLVGLGSTVSRSLSPGNRLTVEPALFSGLGEKNVPLAGGSTYYLARFGALPGLFRLGVDQALVLNQSGRPLAVTVEGSQTASGVLASGTVALGGLGPDGLLTVTWDDGAGVTGQTTLEGGKVYRLLLDSPEGTGTTVSLTRWD